MKRIHDDMQKITNLKNDLNEISEKNIIWCIFIKIHQIKIKK